MDYFFFAMQESQVKGRQQPTVHARCIALTPQFFYPHGLRI